MRKDTLAAGTRESRLCALCIPRNAPWPSSFSSRHTAPWHCENGVPNESLLWRTRPRICCAALVVHRALHLHMLASSTVPFSFWHGLPLHRGCGRHGVAAVEYNMSVVLTCDGQMH